MPAACAGTGGRGGGGGGEGVAGGGAREGRAGRAKGRERRRKWREKAAVEEARARGRARAEANAEAAEAFFERGCTAIGDGRLDAGQRLLLKAVALQPRRGAPHRTALRPPPTRPTAPTAPRCRCTSRRTTRRSSRS